MVFVRNPSGVSHSPEEYVVDQDAETGAETLAIALEALMA
jgi:N-carbamoyl-L-amino-acid hydrolase